MIVKMYITQEYCRLVDCNILHTTCTKESVELGMYNGDTFIESARFVDPTNIYIMDNGKTVDSIRFNPTT